MKQNKENKQGSMTLGALIIMLLVAAVGISIINRTIKGIQIARDMKGGYSAYQGSDREAEEFMNSLRLLDGDRDSGKIPENVFAYNSGYCGASDTECVLKGGATATGAAAMGAATEVENQYSLLMVSELSKRFEGNGLTRFIEVPVQDRIPSGLVASKFGVEACGGTPTNVCSTDNNYNRCDLKLTLEPSSDPSVTGKISRYEPRRSINQKLGDLTLSYGWRPWGNGTTTGVFTSPDDPLQSIILPNGDTIIGGIGARSGGQYGQEYWFTVKAKNKNPFYLDSAYLTDSSDISSAPVSVALESAEDCDNGGAVDTQLYGKGCIRIGTQPVGTMVSDESYNCCNQTECYEPNPNWIPDDPHDCALQKCGFNEDGFPNGMSQQDPVWDSVATNSPDGNGITSGLGYCKDAASTVGCVATPSDAPNACFHPYRVVGYCTDCPPASQGTLPGVNTNSSSWSKQNIIDVDMNPATGSYEGTPFTPTNNPQARCCKQLCPTGTVVGDANTYCALSPNPYAFLSWSASNTTCSNTHNCGPYTLNKKCNLSCAANYSAFTVAYDAEYPLGKCCSETCPSTNNPPFTSHSSPGVTEGDCDYTLDPYHGTSWTNTSTCASNTKCASATVPGYTVTERCQLVCDYNSGKYGVTNSTIFTGSNKACCYHKCSDWTEPSCTQAIPDHSTRTGRYSCSENSCGDYSITNNCSFTCNTNYTLKNGICEPDERSATCSAKPANTVWNTSSTYTQTWDGDSWEPTASPVYDDINAGDCHYKCATNYTKDAWGNCVGSTQTYTCSASKPSNTVWNPASYTQTWDGDEWLPANDTSPRHSDSACTGECCYKCVDSSYTWDGDSCEAVAADPTCTVVTWLSYASFFGVHWPVTDPTYTNEQSKTTYIKWTTQNADALTMTWTWNGVPYAPAAWSPLSSNGTSFDFHFYVGTVVGKITPYKNGVAGTPCYTGTLTVQP